MNTSLFTVEHIRLSSPKSFDRVRAEFERQLGTFDASVLDTLATGEDPEAVRAGIESMAGPNGLMLFAVYDHGAILKIVGHARRAFQYVVGNPLDAIEMTQHAIGASLYAPLRVALYENDEGMTCLEYDRPTSLFGQFPDRRVAKIAALLDGKLERLAATALA